MKKGIIISAVSVLAVAGLFLAVSSPSSETSSSVVQAATATQQPIESVYADVASGSLLLDVRTVEEFDEGHVAQATLLPLADIEAGSVPNVDTSKPLYVYCRSGNRSAEATQILEQAGFTDVVDLGGLEDVAAIGAKIVR